METKVWDDIIKYIDSEEGKKSIDDYINNLNRKENILKNQIERFHNLTYSKKEYFQEFVLKVIEKYESKQYKNRYYKQWKEPSEDLYWFLFEYAKVYGRECSKMEYKHYGNDFTAELYYCNGFYFNQINGQGSFVQIKRENPNLIIDFKWNDSNVIDFVNWYLKVNKISDRFELENMEIINSFKNGDKAEDWWIENSEFYKLINNRK